MPAAFFTRTQIGALISPLNNHVIGAQRALTGALGSVVSYVVPLVSTVIAMAVLQWPLSYGLVVSLSALQTRHSTTPAQIGTPLSTGRRWEGTAQPPLRVQVEGLLRRAGHRALRTMRSRRAEAGQASPARRARRQGRRAPRRLPRAAAHLPDGRRAALEADDAIRWFAGLGRPRLGLTGGDHCIRRPSVMHPVQLNDVIDPRGGTR